MTKSGSWFADSAWRARSHWRDAAVDRQAILLDQARTWAETVQSNGAKIVEAVKKAGEGLLKQVDVRAHLPGLRAV